MNGTEQRERHTAVKAVEKQIEDVQEVVAGLAQQIVDDRDERDRQIRELVDTVNAVLLKGHADQRSYIDAADAALRDRLEYVERDGREAALNAVRLQDQSERQRAYIVENDRLLNAAICGLRDRTFWQRLRWLFLGR